MEYVLSQNNQIFCASGGQSFPRRDETSVCADNEISLPFARDSLVNLSQACTGCDVLPDSKTTSIALDNHGTCLSQLGKRAYILDSILRHMRLRVEAIDLGLI